MSCSIAIENVPEAEFYTIKSIYIPRVFENITQEKIKYTFEVLDLGIVSHIDLVPRGPPNSKMAFIHFKEWFTNSSAQNLAKKILDPESQAKLVYDDPWYWILLPNNKPIGLPREETIEGLKQIISEYKLIIDDLESQLFESWKQDTKKYEEKGLQSDANSTSPVCSTSSWEMSEFDEKYETEKIEKNDKDIELKSFSSVENTVKSKMVSNPPSQVSGFVAKVSNWHSDKERKFLGHVKFEHLHSLETGVQQEQFHDLEMGIKEQSSTPELYTQSRSYCKVIPIQSSNCNYQDNKRNDVSILIEDNVPCDTMFDSKGNRYVRQNGKWFKIEERKIEQHFWCDP